MIAVSSSEGAVHLYYYIRRLTVALLVVSAWGDDAPPPPPDAAPAMSRELLVLTPPGDQIGLAFGAQAELRVRYVDPDSEPIEGARVDFALVSTTTTGATLSAPSAATDATGIARVNVTAGAAAAPFRG